MNVVRSGARRASPDARSGRLATVPRSRVSPIVVGLTLAAACGRTGLELDEFERVAPRVHEAVPGDDAGTPDAPDAAPVVSKTHVLRTFDPATLAFATIGTLDCPTASMPYSMAVDRKGNAYVVYNDGTLFHVSTKTAACTPTPFSIGQDMFVKFGMGFSADTGTSNEHLYVVGADTLTDLATIDTSSFVLSPIGHVPDTGMELTGTGDGRLFGFYQDPNDASLSHIVALDKGTAAYQFGFALPSIQLGAGWAFSFYGGKFWLFTAPSTTTVVTTYDPVTKTIATVASLDDVIVGAGVSTCAPTE